MALPPTIPTSFVPKQAVVARKSIAGFNPFLLVAYVIFIVWIVAAIAVFSYQLYLSRIAKQKAQDLVTAQNNIDQESVTSFIHLRDRFTLSKQLLDKHVVLSQFFDKIENTTIQNVRFTNLKITVMDNRNAQVSMAGMAKNFNALAAQSSIFTSDKDIKNAIFSSFVLDQKDGSVTFQVSADVQPSLVTQTASSATLNTSPAVPATPSTSATPAVPATPSTPAASTTVPTRAPAPATKVPTTKP